MRSGSQSNRGEKHAPESSDTSTLVPVKLSDNSLQVALSTESGWDFVCGMRIRTQPNSSGTVQTQQVESVRVEGGQAHPTVYSTYKRGAPGGRSLLHLQWKTMPEAMPSKAHRWIVVLFHPTEAKAERLLVIGVLSGRFVNRDGSISLKAGQAACVHIQPNEKSEYLQDAELTVRRDGCVLSWKTIEDGYEPNRVQIHAVGSPRVVDSVEQAIESLQVGLPLCAYEMWAIQSYVYYPNF